MSFIQSKKQIVTLMGIAGILLGLLFFIGVAQAEDCLLDPNTGECAADSNDPCPGGTVDASGNCLLGGDGATGGSAQDPNGNVGGSPAPNGNVGGSPAPNGNSSKGCLPGQLCNPLKSTSISQFIGKIIDILLIFAQPIIVLFIMYSGYLFVTAQGNSEQISSARTALLWSVVGGVIVLGARVIIQVIEGTVGSL